MACFHNGSSHYTNSKIKNGDIFGDTYVTDPGDTYPLLAHSAFLILGQNDSMKIPVRLNLLAGWWSQNYNINLPGCSQSRKDPDCWEEVKGDFGYGSIYGI